MATLTRGERFKDARTVYNQHGNQTMDEVAAAIGVSKSLIQSLEDDEVTRSVGYDKVAKLAAHYGVRSDFLLGLTNDHSLVPCAVDDLGLSKKAVSTIENIQNKCDTPNGLLLFGNASSQAMNILNRFLESKYFKTMFANLMLGYDAFLSCEIGSELSMEDFEYVSELREKGHIALTGSDAGKFYANEAASAVRDFMCNEFGFLND